MSIRACRITVAAAMLGLLGSGCGGSTLDQTSSCREFLQADRAEQDKAVARVAEELNVKRVLSPLVRPNIDYICGNDPDETLGGAVQGSGSR
jgi:hypothetical protein